jgi:hypothetical protein
MKQSINEVRRMQQLAGLINENKLTEANSEIIILKPTERFFNAILDSPDKKWTLKPLIDIQRMSVEVDGKPIVFLRKDTEIDQASGMGQSSNNSFFYQIKLTRTGEGKLQWSIDAIQGKEQLNNRPLASGKWESDEISSLDNRGYFKIIAIN